MQRLYIGYIGYTRGVCYSSIVEKLWCDRCYYGYATRMHGLYFNNLAYVFYTAVNRVYMPYIYILSIILYSLFIKYFKYFKFYKFYILNFFSICAVYIQT